MIHKEATFNLMATAKMLLLWSVFAQSAYAVTYSATLENSDWRVQQSALECRLSQSIPRLGKAVFEHKAGKSLIFHLETYHNPLKPGLASLAAEGPVWKVNAVSEAITQVEISSGNVPLEVDYPESGRMLEYLNRGLMPTFGAYSDVDSQAEGLVKVVLSTVNFNPAYQEYLECMTQLLPVNFQQIVRSAVFFDTNASGLSEEVETQLALIARYIVADPRIRRVIIDGHTDDRGDKQLNRNLSMRRTETVAGYFRKEGVSGNRIVSRYHADKYPVLANDTEENRARNRRVTIRLERE